MNHVLGGTLLVAGTCIGAGMLGLPVATAAGGFYWTTSFFLICWALMTLTAFLMLEVSLWHEKETNLISMARHTLGKAGEVVAWGTYVLFLYSIMAAYTSGGTSIAVRALSDFNVSAPLAQGLYIAFFGFIVYLGASAVDFVNRIFMVGLILAYIALISLCAPKVDPMLFQDGQAQYLYAALPLMVTSFGFHLLIPTLKTYLNNNVKQLRLSILLGSAIPLVVYICWEFIILGVIPAAGEKGLIAMASGEPVVELTEQLSAILGSTQIGLLARLFTFFAIVTSFIGVALGLSDFFADGLNVDKTRKGRLFLAVLTFVPPSLFIWLYPNGFIVALTYAGVFAAILLVILPALMVYVGRYRRTFARSYEVMGGKALPVIALVFGGLVIVLQILAQAKVLPIP